MQAGVTSIQPHTTFTVTVEETKVAKEMQTLTVSDNAVAVTFDGATQIGWRIAVASYDAEGRLLGITMQDATGKVTETLTLSGVASAAEVRVFVLDGDSSPQMASLSASGGQ